MTKVCLDCRYLGPRPSGIGEMVRALVDRLPSLAPEWHFVFLRSPSHSQPLSTAANTSEIVVSSDANGPASMWLLPRMVDLGGIDLFHAPANILPAGLSMRTVTTIHDLMWLDQPELCRTGIVGQVQRHYFAHGIRRAFSRSDAITCVSESTRQDILAHMPDAGERVVTTLSGVDDAFCQRPHDPGRLHAHGVTADKFVLTVGQNRPYKNHAGALRAFAHAFADREDVALVFVHRRGAAATKLAKLADELGVGHRVNFLARVEQDDLVSLYNAAQLLLHPSLYEGFGNPLAEAMACGCPVVTSSLSAMPEVTAGAALLADPTKPDEVASAMRGILDDPPLAASLAEKGLVRAKQLDWDDHVAKVLAVYRSVLASPPGATR